VRAISVLVVEDSATDATLLVRELQRSEWLVDHAVVDSESRLREELSRREWDLVVSDFSMPGFGGVQALHIVKNTSRDTPFIFVSGTAGEDVAVGVLQAGADDFLVKGKLARLGLAIDRALREAAERRARREAESAVHRSEERLRAVVESMGDTVFTVDLELKHDRIFGRRATPSGLASTRLLGRTPAEIWGEPVGTAQQAAMRRALAGERTMYEWSIQISEAPLYFQTCFSALKSESGATIGVVGTERDVTQQKLTDARLSATDRMASVGMLAAGVAHEINNPLAALAANVELALRNATSLVESTDAAHDPALGKLIDELEDAHQCGRLIRHVVGDLGMLARTQTEETELIDVRDVLDDALRVTANQIRHSANIVKHYEPVPMVRANASRIGQLFMNLIINAAQAVPPGHSSTNEIRITAAVDEAHPQRVLVEVSDTGTGMSEDVARRLFTPFFTTKPVGHGSGLGLAICHRIVTSLGGTITARSKPGAGSVFRVELPAANAAIADIPSSRATSTSAHAGKRGHLLLIDDDKLLLTLLERVFTDEHEVVATSGATEALRILAEQGPFDLLLCDLMMPEMSGMAFHARVAEIDPALAEHIVFMTGGAFSPEAQEFLARVKNPQIGKPFDLEGLRGLIRNRLETWRTRD
jgi:PAS domain S-box-containing protein